MMLTRRVRRLVPLALFVMELSGCGRSHGAQGLDAGGSSAFEGTVRMGLPDALPTTFEIKGARARWNLVETEPERGYRVYDGNARRLFTVLPKEQSVEVDAVPAAAAQPASGEPPWVFGPSESGKVSGYPCERSKVTHGAESYMVCAARGIAVVPLAYALPGAVSAVPFLDALEEKGELALAATTAGTVGRPAIPRLLTSEVRLRVIDEGRFAIPSYPVSTGKLAVPRALPH